MYALILPLASMDGPFVSTGGRTGGSVAGPWASAVAGIGVERGPLRITGEVPYGVVLGPDGAADGLGQPELGAALFARGVARPEAGVSVGLPLGELADPHWRVTPWAGATVVAGGLETSARIGVSTSPAARPVALALARTASAASLAHGWVAAAPARRGASAPPPDPRLDPHDPDELLASLAVGPHRDDGGRIAGTLSLTRGAGTDLALGLLAATPPRHVRLVGTVSAPIVEGAAGGLRLAATIELRP